jgi:multidrug efflux pump subunit AcrB
MFAQVEMPVGSNAEAVEDCMRTISDFAMTLPEVSSVQMDVAIMMNIGQMGSSAATVQSHVGQIWVELHAADEREAAGMRSSQDVLAELRDLSEGITGVNSITWEVMNGGPIGKEIEVRVTGPDYNELRRAAGDIQEELAAYNGVVDLDDNDDEGRREVQITLRSVARPTGVTRAALGNHVRAATFGAEARRITRNREDVRIMVRYPREFREDVYHIESMWVPAPRDGEGRRGWIPMRELAELKETRGFTQINRSQQQRAISVYGDIDTEVANANDVMMKFKQDFIPRLKQQHPGVSVEMLGAQEEQAKGFSSLLLAAPIALLMIYLLLAALFKSYVQPVVVMSAIPFGIQGAIFGHWLLGMPMTFLSAIGMVALTGIVVNDSLVLVDFVNRRVREGYGEMQASIQGATLRLRPILLTTCTTVAGLTPLMFEKSFQAKFLIPMAVTLTFGLMFATVLTLLIVPVLNMIFFDIRSLVGKLRSPRLEASPQPTLETADIA